MDTSNRLPTMHIVGENIPEAHYLAIKAVWEQGREMRTQYDRKDGSGNFIDPPSRDARVLIEVKDPFAQPRFPPISFCEIGTYIAELFGIKDFKVSPISLLMKMICRNEDLSEEERRILERWPYTYHQRLFAHPDANGNIADQMAFAVETVAKTPYSRRAMLTTAVPNIDPCLTEDIPCLREIQLRCVEEDGILYLNPTTMWRSRDLYKAWGDNVLAITCLLQCAAQKISALSGREEKVGSYADFSCSLHIYGQDFGAVGGNEEKGLQSFWESFPTTESFVTRALPSEIVKDMQVIPQLNNFLTPKQMEQWEFPPESVQIINWLIEQFQTGALTV